MVVQRVVAPYIQVQFLDFTPKDAYSKYSYLQVFDMGLKVLVKYVSCICLDSLMEKLLVEAQKMVVRFNLKAPN